MIQLAAEIREVNADTPDIFDYIVEGVEMILVRCIHLMNYLCQP